MIDSNESCGLQIFVKAPLKLSVMAQVGIKAKVEQLRFLLAQSSWKTNIEIVRNCKISEYENHNQ